MIINAVTIDFSTIDAFAASVAIVGYVIVFSVLVLLSFAYKFIPKIIAFDVRRRMKKQGNCDDCEIADTEGDVTAAITLALYMNINELHDEESDVITIRRVAKQYSPWSSKIYATNPFVRI
ncbi:MAG TPA: OadG family protein [Bacteroidales bacterium]|nr:OadG family protein [Bacteroidales bacterium]